jgi:hypothetical protein
MPTAYGNPNSPKGQAKLAAAKAVGLDANANWAMIEKAQKEQAALAAARAATNRATQQASEAKTAAELTIKQNKNEADKRNNESNLSKQQKQLTTENKNQVTDQKEREEMVRTFQTRRRGRASLRINLGSYGSSYEGSSGISINL